MTARLLEKYRKEVIAYLKETLKIDNIMALPRLQKITVNVGCGEGARDIKIAESVRDDLAMITGQMPVITRAKKAIANFKIREGHTIGCMVTLRGRRMYEFFDRLVNVTIPRIRDFRGVSPKAFDQQGNYNMGLVEHTVFPEIDIDKVTKTFGMNITFVIKNGNKEKSYHLLKALGMPFYK
jgi:large subunit ribosomal protein L5